MKKIRLYDELIRKSNGKLNKSLEQRLRTKILFDVERLMTMKEGRPSSEINVKRYLYTVFMSSNIDPVEILRLINQKKST